MRPQEGNPISLSDKCIWIIDDDIPIQKANFDKDSMLNGSYPIDKGALLSLLREEENWEDKAVLELCSELISATGDFKAFILPMGAIGYLLKGNKPPDVIIFDMNYRNIQDKNTVLDHLEKILKMCISVVQIYTKETLEENTYELEPLINKYPNRLQPPRLKSDTHADQLEIAISEKLAGSLSAQLAVSIRRLSTIAIENVLVRIDDLPLDIAVNLLAGDDDENLQDEELIELLSSKISGFLASSKELEMVIKDYAQKAQVPAEKEKPFVDEAVQLFAASVRSSIQYDRWLYSAVKTARKTERVNNLDADSQKKIVQDFFAFRLYDHPGDDIVRTGDIISISPIMQDGALPDLFVVLTPSCDLDRFWKKTRGVLTLAKMRPLTVDIGVRRWKDYDNQTPNKTISSITSTGNPFVFPSVPISETDRGDYALFLYEIENKEYDGRSLLENEPGGSKKVRFTRPLTYPELKIFSESAKRYCRISEPFLTGVLSILKDHIFRSGVPDFPKNEGDRLLECFKNPK